MPAIYKNGVMVRCSNAPCYRQTRYVNLNDSRQNTNPPWICENCEKGNAPYIPKNIQDLEKKNKIK